MPAELTACWKQAHRTSQSVCESEARVGLVTSNFRDANSKIKIRNLEGLAKIAVKMGDGICQPSVCPKVQCRVF